MHAARCASACRLVAAAFGTACLPTQADTAPGIATTGIRHLRGADRHPSGHVVEIVAVHERRHLHRRREPCVRQPNLTGSGCRPCRLRAGGCSRSGSARRRRARTLGGTTKIPSDPSPADIQGLVEGPPRATPPRRSASPGWLPSTSTWRRIRVAGLSRRGTALLERMGEGWTSAGISPGTTAACARASSTWPRSTTIPR